MSGEDGVKGKRCPFWIRCGPACSGAGSEARHRKPRGLRFGMAADGLWWRETPT